MSVDTIQKIASSLASVANTVAIIIGGIFAWRKWGKQVPLAARGDLSHEVSSCLVSESIRLVHVALTIRNIGNVTLTPKEAYTIIQKVAPLEGDFGKKVIEGKDPVGVTKVELDWPVIGRRDYPVIEDNLQIDSGETEKLHADFMISSEETSFFVYSMACLDAADPELGWETTSLYEIRDGMVVSNLQKATVKDTL